MSVIKSSSEINFPLGLPVEADILTSTALAVAGVEFQAPASIKTCSPFILLCNQNRITQSANMNSDNDKSDGKFHESRLSRTITVETLIV